MYEKLIYTYFLFFYMYFDKRDYKEVREEVTQVSTVAECLFIIFTYWKSRFNMYIFYYFIIDLW